MTKKLRVITLPLTLSHSIFLRTSFAESSSDDDARKSRLPPTRRTDERTRPPLSLARQVRASRQCSSASRCQSAVLLVSGSFRCADVGKNARRADTAISLLFYFIFFVLRGNSDDKSVLSRIPCGEFNNIYIIYLFFSVSTLQLIIIRCLRRQSSRNRSCVITSYRSNVD